MSEVRKNPPAPKKRAAGTCESCEFYDYDEYYDAYVCAMNLDEDEMVDFLSRDSSYCPYYRFYDEYKSVQRQI